MFVSCAPGNYTLRTGAGPLHNDPNCLSTHCELLQQDIMATIVVVSPGSADCLSQNPLPVFQPQLLLYGKHEGLH